MKPEPNPAIRMFRHAIVRKPCPEMVHGITTAGLGLPDFATALLQHARYVEALERCGLRVLALDADSRFPDSVFIEDVAVCTPSFALVTNPGAPSRNGETAGIREVLNHFYDIVYAIEPPGTLEGGDVMLAGDTLYVGLSERTNPEGAGQLAEIARRHGLKTTPVPLSALLHLKTGIAYLENDNILIINELYTQEIWKPYRRIPVPDGEWYAANSLWINGTVLVPMGFPETCRRIGESGYRTIAVDTSEFRKLDGGLSCLSLRF